MSKLCKTINIFRFPIVTKDIILVGLHRFQDGEPEWLDGTPTTDLVAQHGIKIRTNDDGPDKMLSGSFKYCIYKNFYDDLQQPTYARKFVCQGNYLDVSGSKDGW